jgi:DNA anti-recombination protein RmuC
MDFESYIGKERQLLGRIEKERAELNSHEPNAWEGNYKLAADEIKLLKAGDYVNSASETAAGAIATMDERMSQLRKLDGDASARNEAFLKRVDEWETKFDARYSEVMAAMAREMAALEARNTQLTQRIETAERNLGEISRNAESALRGISSKSEKSMREIGELTEQNLRQASERAEASIREMSEITGANMKDLSKTTAEDVERLVCSLKNAQAEFEASVNEKLEQDRQTLERIKFMITAMNEIIKT